MKILFMGTPDFAKESLENLYNNGYEICGVVTTPDRPSGRGMKLNISPVKEYALEKKLNIFQPEKITNNTEFKDEIKALNPDLVCVVSYGVILPKSFLKIYLGLLFLFLYPFCLLFFLSYNFYYYLILCLSYHFYSFEFLSNHLMI